MSADRQRLKSAIQRIAKSGSEIRSLLDAAQNKGSKPVSAGVGISEAEESRLCCDGSTSSSANPGTEAREPDSGGQDGLDSNDPARLTSGAGTLSGVTDCETGEPVCFNGAGFIPPDGWDEPDDPPPADKYQAGYFWFNDSRAQPEDTYSDTPSGSAETSCSTQPFPGCVEILSYEANSTDSSGEIDQYLVEYLRSDDETSFWAISRGSCSALGGEEFSCTDEPPLESEWPHDACVNLAIVNGKIVGSKYDPDQDGSYSAPRDSIDLCDPENGARITLRASGQSDWKTIDAINGGDGYLYSGGKQIARVSGDEFTDPNV